MTSYEKSKMRQEYRLIAYVKTAKFNALAYQRHKEVQPEKRQCNVLAKAGIFCGI